MTTGVAEMDKGTGNDTGRQRGWKDSQIKLTRKQKMNLTLATARTVRTTWEARWQDAATHSDPYGFIISPIMANQGFRKDQKLLDTTPLKCRKVLRSGLFTSITPSASSWIRARHPNVQINKIPAVKAWNDVVTEVIEHLFHLSNFYDEAPNYFDKCGTYATAAMFIEDDWKNFSRVTVFPTGSYWCTVDEKGFVDTFIYQVRMTVREVISEFCTDEFTGKINLDNCSKALVNYYNNANYEAPIDIIHFIGPRDLYDGPDKGDGRRHPYKRGSRISNEKKYGSWRYEWSLNAESMTGMEEAFGDAFLSESGFDQFPVLVTPWERTNQLDAYGTSSPGLDALPDEHELFFTRSQALMVKEKIQSPPTTGDGLLKQEDYSDLPGAYNPETPNQNGGKGLRAIYQINAEAITAFRTDIKELQEAVEEAWDTNTFQLLSNYENLKDVTAMAVTELKAEKMQKLGAVYGTFNDHFIKPLFARYFQIAWERGLIPPPPKEYGGGLPTPELLGTMAQAMKLSNLALVERFINFNAGLAKNFPTVPIANELNFSRIDKDYAEILSIDSDYFNTDEEKATIQKAQARQQQQKQQQEQLPAMAGAAKDLSDAQTDQPSALTALLGMNQAGQ